MHGEATIFKLFPKALSILFFSSFPHLLLIILWGEWARRVTYNVGRVKVQKTVGVVLKLCKES